jgi:predicted DCC family thiol-disulfide oxidoreductase YuxK
MRRQPPTLYYDGECRFCRASVNLARRRLAPAVRWTTWQESGLQGRLRDRARVEVLVVHPDGRVWGGADAVAVLLLAAPRRRWWPLGWLLRRPGVARIARAAYALVSRNRGRIPLPGGAGA